MVYNDMAGFRGRLNFCSNFYSCKVLYRGLTYDNAESAFQAQKCKNKKEREDFVGIRGVVAKSKIKEYVKVSNWKDISLDIMYEVLTAKFSQNDDLRYRLLNTSDEDLVEYNYWHDNFWGVCRCSRCADLPKFNMLGEILKIVKAELKR